MRQMRNRFFLLSVLFALAGVFALAQANSDLTGIVTDQSGAVVAGAKISLTDPATGLVKTTESGATGLYRIGGLNPANYNLKVSAKGFQNFVQTGIVVNVSATVGVDIKLTVGAENQTVTVEADALAVQTDSNVVSTLISSEQITEIATENRNFAALAALGLGVSSLLPDNNTPHRWPRASASAPTACARATTSGSSTAANRMTAAAPAACPSCPRRIRSPNSIC